jgi:hypothetical protein
MASGNSLGGFSVLENAKPVWFYVAFTGGSTEPSLGDTIWGDTSNANAVLEYLSLESGTWGGNDAAGYMLLSNHDGTAWSSGENFTANTTSAGDHGTLTSTPVSCFATIDRANNNPVLDFHADVNEVALFKGVMPQHYGGSGLTIRFGVSSTTTTGDMSFFAFLKSITDNVDNLNNVGTDPSGLKVFAAPQKNQAIDAASGVGRVRYFDITFTDGAQMDNIAAGELFQLLVMRDAQDSTNDDMAADAQLEFIDIKET